MGNAEEREEIPVIPILLRIWDVLPVRTKPLQMLKEGIGTNHLSLPSASLP